MTAEDERLRSMLQDLVSNRGITVTECCFLDSKEFNIRWSVRGSSMVFKMSDYLADAPDIVLEQFLKGALTRIFGGRHTFGQDYLDYIRSDEFIIAKRPIYFKRARSIRRTDIGEHRNIYDSVQRLLDAGLLNESDIQNTLFTWTSKPTLTRLGYCAQMFRVVVISNVFDDTEVSERLLDYVVYHECLHLRQGYRPFNHNPHDTEFHRQEKMFPGYSTIDEELRAMLKKQKAVKKPVKKMIATN